MKRQDLKTSRRITRRELLGLMGTTALAARSVGAQVSVPEYAALDHIELYVSDVEKSRDFLVRLFGNTLKSRGTKRYLKLGSAYMAFEPPRGNATDVMDHFSVAIKSLEMSKLHQFLDQRGIAYRDYPSGRDTGITDPDNIRTQLSPEDGWSVLVPPNFSDETVTMDGNPVFRPRGLDHVVLNVADLDKSAAFYRQFMGTPAQTSPVDGIVWFQLGTSRLGLQKTPSNGRSGLHRFCVGASFDSQTAPRRLRELGATVESVDSVNPVQFRFDNLRIQVTPVVGRVRRP